MKVSNKISTRQIRALVVCATIGTGILSLPNDVALYLGNDGWVAILLMGLMTLPPIILINKTFELYPNKNFFEIGRILIGKHLFNVFLIIFLLNQILGMAIISRSFSEMIKSFLMERTPNEIIIFSFILVCVYLSRTNIEIIGRMSYHIYPLIIGFIIFLVAISLPSIDLSNMLPVFQSDIKNLPNGIGAIFSSFIGFQVLFFALPFCEDKKNSLNASITGMVLCILMYLIIFIVSLSQFGLSELKRQIIPMFALIKELDNPIYFLENLDGLVVAFWVLVVFATISPVFYSSGKILGEIFKHRDSSIFILPLVPIIYIIAIVPYNLMNMSNFLIRVSDILSFVLFIIMPVITYFLAKYKAGRKQE